MKKIQFLLVILVGISMIAAQPAQKSSGKVFISVDMEGIWGVVHSEQITAGSADYGNARRWMAEDTNAVIEGLLEAGAAEIVVNDSHASMRNLIPGTLHSRATLISGTPKPLSMMEGIDASFSGCIFVGYHARAGVAPAILDHTISGTTIYAIRINGQELPELGINAAIAGYFKVPVIMLSGDIQTCAMARSILGAELVTASVKEALGRTAAKLFPAEEARKRLREAAKEAWLKKDKSPLFRLNAPLTFEVDFHNSSQAELASLLPQVKRPNPRTVTFTTGDYLEGFKLMRVIIALGGI